MNARVLRPLEVDDHPGSSTDGRSPAPRALPTGRAIRTAGVTGVRPRRGRGWSALLVLALLVSTPRQAVAVDISVLWDPVIDATLLGYKAYYGAAPGVYDGTFANEGAGPFDLPLCTFADPYAPAFTFTGIDSGTYTCFATTAYNDAGESGYSNEVCAVVVYRAEISAIPGGDAALRVSWNAPAADDGGNIDHYRIHYDVVSRDAGGSYVGTGADQGDSPVLVPVASLADPQRPSLRLTGLQPDTAYYVAVGVHTAPGACDPAAWEGCRNSLETSGRTGRCSSAAECDDGRYCTGQETCDNGQCQAGAPPCSADAHACTSTCDEDADACNVPKEGACLIGGACHRRCEAHPSTACQTCAPEDSATAWSGCSGLSHECRTGTCDASNVCAVAFINGGAACNTADLCATSVCVEGFCSPTPVDCSGQSGPCTDGTCNPSTGACVATPARPSQACDDGDACTSGDVCVTGQCRGPALDCSHLTAGCDVGVCLAGVCEVEAGSEGSSCDDGDPCTTNDLCASGACAGTATSCASLDGACSVGVCVSGTCQAQDAHEGGGCDDGDPCTTGDTCVSGQCEGAAVDCSNLDDVCTEGVCSGGACEAQDVEDGRVCGTGPGCAVSTCQTGQCVDSGSGCSALDAACAVGVCNPTTDQCEAQPAHEGGACDDGDACTAGEACTGGVCAGGTNTCGEDTDADTVAGEDTAGAEDLLPSDVDATNPLSQEIRVGGGCGCTVPGEAVQRPGWLLLVVAGLWARRRRAVRRSGR